MYELLKNSDVPVHASTQMGIHNLDGALALEKLGVERIVLARETPLTKIEDIHKNSNIELESFVHGALCASFSGQCYCSYMKGKRSGNKGMCAQPCRLNYSGTYPLSTNDIMMIDHLRELKGAGISTLKIEGRSKRHEYAGVVTKAYRLALDEIEQGADFDRQKEINNLIKIYNRGGFSTGYYYGKKNIYSKTRPNHIGEKVGTISKVAGNKIYINASKEINVYDGLSFFESKTGLEISDLYSSDGQRVKSAIGDISFSSILKGVKINDTVFRTTDRKQIEEINEQLAIDDFKITLQGKCKLEETLELTLETTDGLFISQKSNYVPQDAIKKPISKEDVIVSLGKTGDSVFEFENLEVDISGNKVVPKSELNALRRDGFNKLIQAIIKPKHRQTRLNNVDIAYPNTNVVLTVSYEGLSKNGDINFSYNENLGNIALMGMTDDLGYYDELITKDKWLLCSNFGQLMRYKEKCNCVTNFQFNVTNKASVDFLYAMGAKLVVQSIECEKRLLGTIKMEEGMIPIMYFSLCPKKETVGCKQCKTKELREQNGNKLLFYCKNKVSSMLLSQYKNRENHKNKGLYYIYDANGERE